MASFKYIVNTPTRENKVQKDKFSISIQIYHNYEKRYIRTGHYVGRRQLTSEMAIKDEKVMVAIYSTIKVYQDKLLNISDMRNMNVDDIKSYLLDDNKKKSIDFFEFGMRFIATQGIATGKNTLTALTSFKNYIGTDKFNINELNLKLINLFVVHLRSERSINIANNKRYAPRSITLKPMGDTGIKDYIGKLRQIFLAARTEYNDEDIGHMPIPHYPFRNFKMPKAAVAKKRNIKPDIIKLIRDTPDMYKKNDLARDVFMLSFYLVGMNVVDIFNLTDYKDGRISYYRAKTESRKGDKAFITIKVEPEAAALIEKHQDYRGERVFNFYLKYNKSDGFLAAVNAGLKYLVAHHNNEAIKNNSPIVTDKKITSYYARGAWSNIAWNDCKISKDTIAFAFNHSDPTFKVTDLYIEEDYSNVDEANRKVLNTLLEKKKTSRKIKEVSVMG